MVLVPVREHDGLDSSARSRTYSKSGSTRSIPCMSADGNDSPTSMISMRPSSSRQAMLRPTSPIPPRKTRRQSASGSAKEPGVLQRLADAVALLGSWPGTSGRRGAPAGRPTISSAAFTRDRVRRDEQGVEQRRELLVDLPRCRHVAGLDQVDHLVDLRADEVARDAHDADGAQAHVAERRPSRRPSRPRTPRAPR